MPRHRLIDDYLRVLRTLPAGVIDELADGLVETYDRHRARGRAPDDAARATIEEFGAPDQVLAAFDRIAPGRRLSRLLLALGPFVGLCWGAALVSARAWTWPIPAWTPVTLGAALAAVIALLLAAAYGRRLRRAAPLAAGGVLLIDAAAICGVLATAPTIPWPLRAAILGSLARACLTARTLPHLRVP